MNVTFAQTTPQPIRPGDAEFDTLVGIAKAPAEQDLDQVVQIEVETLDRLGPWVFLLGKMRGIDGGPLTLENTPYAEAAAEGGISDAYVALLRKDADTWTVVDHAVGPTDVIWLDWPQEHAAPRALFGF